MSVIVFDGRYLAADRRCVSDGVTQTVAKIGELEKPRGCFNAWGVTGDFAFGMAIREWWLARRKNDDFPKPYKDAYARFFVFAPGLVREFAAQPNHVDIKTNAFAAGSGRDFALMALHLGKSVKEAVKLTSELTIDCGNGVDAIVVWRRGQH